MEPYNLTGLCTYANQIFVLDEGLGIFRLGPIATGWKMIQPGNLSFAKRNLVGKTSGN